MSYSATLRHPLKRRHLLRAISRLTALLLGMSPLLAAATDASGIAERLTACAAYAQGGVGVVIAAGVPQDGEWYADWSAAVNQFATELPTSAGVTVSPLTNDLAPRYAVYLYRQGANGLVIEQRTELAQYQAALLQISGQPANPDQPTFEFAEADPALLAASCPNHSLKIAQ